MDDKIQELVNKFADNGINVQITLGVGEKVMIHAFVNIWGKMYKSEGDSIIEALRELERDMFHPEGE